MVLAVIVALAVIALRLILHATGAPPQGADFMLAHFLAIATIVFFAGFGLLRRDREAGFPALAREGFKGAALYALIMLGFLWAYYTWVETDAFSKRIEPMVLRAVEEGHPEGEVRGKLMRFFTPINYASGTFFLLLAIGAFNALLIAAIHHKLLRRAMR